MNANGLVDLYLRLSIDKEGKDSLERQEADLREWAAREGLTVRRVWKDAGKSGYKRGVKRPEFDAAVKAVTSGDVATLAVWKLDRLSRRGAGQVGTVLDAVAAVGGRIYFLKDGYDSSDSGHRMVIIMVSEQARAESANTSVRVSAKKEVDRKAGRYLGGSEPFGYAVGDDRKLRQKPHEALLVREAFDRLMDGATMLQVCRDWSDRGIPTRRTGTHWRSSSMSVFFRSPTLAGLVPDHREQRAEGYHGADLRPWRDPDTGETVSLMADGEEPILTEGERMALLRVLDGRQRKYGRGLRTPKQPTSLLGGGMVICATCSRKCNSFGNSYRCPKRGYVGDACERPVNVTISVLEDAVKREWAHGLAKLEPDDELLQAVASRWLARNDPGPIRERDELTERLKTLEARVADADHDRYVRETLSPERHASVTDALLSQMARVRGDLAALPEPSANISALLDPELSLPAIKAASALEARALLRLAIDNVIVTAAPHPGARFQAHQRLRIVWAGDAGGAV